MKICSKCKIKKEDEDFYKDPRIKQDGLYGKCILCHNRVARVWQKKNPDKMRSAANRWSKKNPTKVNAKLRRYRSTPEGRAKTRQWNINYKQANKAKINSINAARRALQFNATPPWTTPEMKRDIEFIYYIREGMINPREWAVDHYYPLNGENSTGLHVPWNLRLLKAVDNVSKLNHEPEPLPLSA